MESIAEYKKRTFDLVAGADGLTVQRATAATLRRIISSVPQELLTRKPAPNKWSIAEIIAHLADDEIVLGYRIRSILANSGCAIVAFDQDRWASVMRYSEIPAEVSLERFERLREWNLALLEQLTDEEWERFGMHEERGRESVRDLALFYAGHDRNHLQQIERIVSS